MHIKRFLFRLAYTALIASTLSGCISFHRAYIQILGVVDIDVAYRQANELVSHSVFNKYIGKDKSKFDNTYYLYQIVEHHPRGELSREFSISVWRDAETDSVILFFGEANVSVFSTEGRIMFDELVQKVQAAFRGNRITYGEDEKTLDALWERLHAD